MNRLTKVVRLKLVYFICLLILLGGHSFQIGHKDGRIDDFESDNDELRNTCAASFDSEDAIAVCMGEVSVQDNNMSFNPYVYHLCSNTTAA